MLLNLKAEYVRKGKVAYKEVTKILGCSERTARNKISGETEFTVPEALKIINADFKGDGFTIEYLFADAKEGVV